MKASIKEREPIRVHVTIPDEARVVFNWLLKYDDRFKDRPAASLAADLIAAGVKALYENQEPAEPLDAPIYSALVEQSLSSIKKAAT